MKLRKRIIASVLAIVMAISSLPFSTMTVQAEESVFLENKTAVEDMDPQEQENGPDAGGTGMEGQTGAANEDGTDSEEQTGAADKDGMDSGEQTGDTDEDDRKLEDQADDSDINGEDAEKREESDGSEREGEDDIENANDDEMPGVSADGTVEADEEEGLPAEEGTEDLLKGELSQWMNDTLYSSMQDNITEEAQGVATGCYITEIVKTGDSEFTVALGTQRDCSVLVAIFDEENIKFLGFGQTDVQTDQTTATVNVAVADMPQYFYVRGWLIDTKSLAPLSGEYESSMYTQAMQELMVMTTVDFDVDRVVNLDEDETTNFMILKEDVVRISRGELSEAMPESGQKQQSLPGSSLIRKNDLVNFDAATKTFEFQNCDSDFLESAMLGSKITYEYDEYYMLYIEVERVIPAGTTLKIVAKETTDIQDFMEYIKIDGSENGENAEVNWDRCDAGVRFDGKEIDKVGSAESLSVKFKYTIEKKAEDSGKLDDTKPGDIDPSFKEGFKVDFTLQLAADLKYYMTPQEKYFQISITHKEQVEGYFAIEGEFSILLGDYMIPFLAGGLITLDFPLRFVIRGSAKGDVSFTSESTWGYKISDGKISAIKESKSSVVDLKVELEIFAGLEFEPTVSILYGLIGELKITATVGVKIDSKTVLLSSAVAHHDCTMCVEGNLKVGCEIAASMKIAMFPKMKTTVGPWELNMLDREWYNDVCHKSGFCFGKCPNLRYKVDFVVKDGNGFLQKDLKVEIDGEAETTDANGKCSFWLHPGSDYHVKVKKGKVIVGEAIRHVASESTSFIINVNLDKCLNVKEVVSYASTDAGVSAVITADDALYLWGNNTYGQLGNGTTINSSVPVKALDNVKYAQVRHNAVFAVTNDGELYTWGRNMSGVLGTGDTKDCHAPHRVGGLLSDSKVVSISLHSTDSLETNVCAAITSTGNLYMWGSGKYGILGTGEENDVYMPIFVMQGVKQVYAPGTNPAEQKSMFALTKTDSLYSWGYNDKNAYILSKAGGILGTGSQRISCDKPAKVLDEISYFEWTGGYNGSSSSPFAMAVAKDGTLYMWGANNFYQLGQGDGYTYNDCLSEPTFVLDDVKTVCCDTSQSSVAVVLAVQNDGDLYQWGSSSKSDNHKPVLIAQNVKQVYGGYSDHMMLNDLGELYTWSGQGNVPSVKVGDGGYTALAYSARASRQCYWALNEAGELYSYNVDKKMLTKEVGNIEEICQAYFSRGWYGAIAQARGADGTLYLLDWSVTAGSLVNVTEVFQTALATESAAAVRAYGDLPMVRNSLLMQAEEYAENKLEELVPQRIYEYYVVRDKAVEDILTNDNVLYIGQGVTDTEGSLALSYVPREEYDNCELFVVEMAPRSIDGAVITVSDFYAMDGEQYAEVSVVYRGETLEAGVDYIVSGDYLVKQAGKYSVTITGIGLYEGERTLEYHVWTPGAVICSVKFLNENGELLKEERKESGESVAAITAPEVPGYRFIGWYLGDLLYDFDMAVTGDLELYARYERLEIPVTGISLNYTEYVLSMMEAGQREVQLVVAVEPENADYEKVLWTSGDETVAVVSDEGLVKAISEGMVEITATVGSCTASCEIAVVGGGNTGGHEGEDIAGGTYENITWRIDADGKLTVEGTGELCDSKERERMPWYDQRDSIKFAVVCITGLRDASYMFAGCTGLTSLDLSGFDASSVTDMRNMLDGCSSLVMLYTPNNLPHNVNTEVLLPAFAETDIWYDAEGTTYTKLPEELEYSIILTKNEVPIAMEPRLIVKLTKTFYELESVIGPEDLTVKYRGSDGSTRTISYQGDDNANIGYTMSAVDMSTPGEKTLTISYNDGKKTLTEDVKFTVVEHVTEEPIDSIGLHVVFTKGRTFTYTGRPIEPVVEVTNNGKSLTEGTDYTVKYSNNTKAGTAKLTVTGKGSFTGKQDTTFTIEPKSLQDNDIVARDITIAVNSKAAPVVVYNGMKLGAKDYTLSNTGKITEDAVLTITGKGNYKDSITVNANVMEAPRKFKVNMNKVKLIYNGDEQKLGFEVLDSKTKEPLKEDEYMAVYSKDVISAGTIKVTVIGLGKYSGSVTKSYKINPLKTDMELSFDKQKEYTFNSAGTTVDNIVVKVKDSGKELEYGKDYKINYSASRKAGTGKISVTFLGNYKGSKAVKDTFTILPEVLNDSTVDVTVPDKAYMGKKNAYKSAPIVTDKNGNALKKTDYVVAYYADYEMTKEIKGKENLIELAEGDDTATVYVRITGKGNYAGDTNAYVRREYHVRRTTVSVLDISKAKVTFKNGNTTVKKIEYTGLPLEPDVEVTVKVKGVGTITLDSSQYDVKWINNVNKGKAMAVITGKGIQVGGYAFVGSKNATISIVSKNVKNVRDLFKENVSNLLKKIY